MRFAGKSRLGFYPLPLSEAQRVRSFLSFPASRQRSTPVSAEVIQLAGETYEEQAGWCQQKKQVRLDGGGPSVQPDAESVALHTQRLAQNPDARNVRMQFIASGH